MAKPDLCLLCGARHDRDLGHFCPTDFGQGRSKCGECDTDYTRYEGHACAKPDEAAASPRPSPMIADDYAAIARAMRKEA